MGRGEEQPVWLRIQETVAAPSAYVTKPITQTDREISAGFQRGERWAFEAAARRYFAHLMNFVAHLLQDRERAMELTQEAFYLACRAHKGVDPNSSPAPWLFRIARNLAYKEFARRKKQPEVPLEDENGEIQVDSSASEENPRSITEKSEWLERIHRALDRLHPKHRDVLILRMIQGLPGEETAAMLRIPVATVNTRVHRALQQLRRLARQEGLREEEVFL